MSTNTSKLDAIDEILKPLKRHSISIAFEMDLDAAKTKLAALILESRQDELVKAAPHQVAVHFQIKADDLNASWYLDYIKTRNAELKSELAVLQKEQT